MSGAEGTLRFDDFELRTNFYQIPTQSQNHPGGSINFVQWDQIPGKRGVKLTRLVTDSSDGKIEFLTKICPYHPDSSAEEAEFLPPTNKLLGQFRATAICGNNIASSIVYTAGLVAKTSSYYAPFCMLMVVGLLYSFRRIYVELITGLPVNGGTYTGLLNTTGKGIAVTAACLSFLSYVATVVVSATSAVEYLKDPFWPELNVMAGTIFLIVIFAGIMLLGIRESASLAMIIFTLHIITLITLMSTSFAYACSTKFSILASHYRRTDPMPDPFESIVFGFTSAMLGVTGFESSANFVEQQAAGVFSKTLRNMWIIVAFVNPLVSLLSFAVVPIEKFYEPDSLDVTLDVRRSLLALMAEEMATFLGGNWLQKVVIFDVILVLCGAVLTGFVGVCGLLKRTVDDNIFPRIFLASLPKTEAQYPIILSFCGVCVTLVLVTQGHIEGLSGVYTVAFLSVMILLCVSNMLLKHTRRELKRDVKAKWYRVIACALALGLALVGNCIHNEIIIAYSALYFLFFASFFYGMFARTFFLRGFLTLISSTKQGNNINKIRNSIENLVKDIEAEPVVFFSRRLNLRELNIAVQQVLDDELSKSLKIVNLYESPTEIPDNLPYCLHILSKVYPSIRLDILLIRGRLTPGTVRLVESLLGVRSNRMFIACPSQTFPYNVAELGSVRIIMSRTDRGLGGGDAEGSVSSQLFTISGMEEELPNRPAGLLSVPSTMRERAFSIS